MTKNDLINQACKLAEDGLAVFPVRVTPDKARPGKHTKVPLLPWTSRSTCSITAIEDMDWSKATHVGIDCGKSGICVLDVDDKKALTKFLVPPTRMQETISGGQHWLYLAPKHHQANTAGSPMAGLDIRGEGGFIVWYGRGEMAADAMEPWPWQVPFVNEPAAGLKGQAHAASLDYMPRVITSGGRNHDAISYAGVLMNKWPQASLDIMLDALTGHSQLWHSPPMDKAELIKVAASAMRWRKEVDLEEVGPEYYGPWGQAPRTTPPPAFCGEWLRGGSITLVHARAGLGKTSAIGSLVECMKKAPTHTGQSWAGMRCTDPGDILWVNGDMALWQLQEKLGYLGAFGTGVQLWDCPNGSLLARPDAVVNRCVGKGLVIFDTRSTLFQMADANVAEAWDAVAALCKQVARSTCMVILVSHTGKGEGAASMGSSAQEWFVDNIISLAKVKQDRRMSFQKSRLCAQPEDCDYRMVDSLDGVRVRWDQAIP